jgi:hypothetical protein
MSAPVLSTDVARRPHKYDPDPRSTTSVPLCRCGMTRAYRSHQPWYWRLLNPGVNWR